MKSRKVCPVLSEVNRHPQYSDLRRRRPQDDGQTPPARLLERKGASRVPSWGRREKMAMQDSSKAAAEIAQRSPISKVDADLRELQQSHITLAENKAWLDKNADKLISK
jgi:hypothetical protein